MKTQNIETSTSSMSVLNVAFKGFREQFNVCSLGWCMGICIILKHFYTTE